MVMYFLQSRQSHLALVTGLERDVMHRICTISEQSDNHTMFYNLYHLDVVIRSIFNSNHAEVPFRLINTVMIITYKISKNCESEISELSNRDILRSVRRNVLIFLLCFREVSDIISSQDNPAAIKTTHEDMLSTVGQYLNHLDRLIRRRLRELVNRNQEPIFNLNQQNVLGPKYLKDEESLNSCPRLKEKLASSNKTLVEAAADDLCSVCLEENISARDNFAILDKCAHLFCQLCIDRWFKTA